VTEADMALSKEQIVAKYSKGSPDYPSHAEGCGCSGCYASWLEWRGAHAAFELGKRAGEVERDELRAIVRELLADDKPYPLTDVLAQLADAADHLLNYHSCDVHGYEGIGIVRDIAREMVGVVEKARTAVGTP